MNSNKRSILVLILLLSLANTGYIGYFHYHKVNICSSGLCSSELANNLCHKTGIDNNAGIENHGKCPICELISTAERYALVSAYISEQNHDAIDNESVLPINYGFQNPANQKSRAPPGDNFLPNS